jgi:hypothetical protein
VDSENCTGVLKSITDSERELTTRYLKGNALTVIREPMERFLSAFHFLKGWYPTSEFWKTYPCELDVALLLEGIANRSSTIQQKIEGIVAVKEKHGLMKRCAFQAFWPQAFWFNAIVDVAHSGRKAAVVCYDKSKLLERTRDILHTEFGCRDTSRSRNRSHAAARCTEKRSWCGSESLINSRSTFQGMQINRTQCRYDDALMKRTAGAVRRFYAEDNAFWGSQCRDDSRGLGGEASAVTGSRRHPPSW